MSSRGRSRSPKRLDNGLDTEMAVASTSPPAATAATARVVIIAGLSRNVAESHLRAIFACYGELKRMDVPVYAKSGQNRGKAAIEYFDTDCAQKAASHMNNGQLDGAVITVELSDLPIAPRSRSNSRARMRNGRDRRSMSFSRSRSPPRRVPDGGRDPPPARYNDFRNRPGPNQRRPPPRNNSYYPGSRSRSPPLRRMSDRPPPPRRRSPSYERGGTHRGARKSPSPSSSRSSRSRSRNRSRPRRSRSRSITRSRSRSRSGSYSSYTASSRSRSRSRSVSLKRKSRSRDDLRDSNSRSRSPASFRK